MWFLIHVESLFQDIQRVEEYLPLVDNIVHYCKTQASSNAYMDFRSQDKMEQHACFLVCFHLKGPIMYQVHGINLKLGIIHSLYCVMLQDSAFEARNDPLFILSVSRDIFSKLVV